MRVEDYINKVRSLNTDYNVSMEKVWYQNSYKRVLWYRLKGNHNTILTNPYKNAWRLEKYNYIYDVTLIEWDLVRWYSHYKDDAGIMRGGYEDPYKLAKNYAQNCDKPPEFLFRIFVPASEHFSALLKLKNLEEVAEYFEKYWTCPDFEEDFH
ncbi:hypothetical protein GCM10007216_19990 [Thalassobacillus devorans]|uniref:Uncharacterized protein n=1 Tax=Thalassobacillus devorans TaxID=279813 RepID=A0ABQ1P1G7_9BACI|nr:hypothetical protein [Thalassobacillus devorans]NIK28057.1 hypothetical protein [Thalassobacillus devorans]GGC89202.1 hypothetical protein GCM10007216_19990 [Thalassobacillus devorans]